MALTPEEQAELDSLEIEQATDLEKLDSLNKVIESAQLPTEQPEVPGAISSLFTRTSKTKLQDTPEQKAQIKATAGVPIPFGAGGLTTLILDLISAPGRATVAAIDKATGVEDFIPSLGRLEATGESGKFSGFLENIVRAPDTFVGFLTGGPTAKLGTILAKKALTSPPAAKALGVLFDAFQQGTLASATNELDQIAQGNEAELGRFIKSAAIGALAETGLRGLVATGKKAAKGTLETLKSAPEAISIPPAQLKPDVVGFQETPATITGDPLRKAIEAKAQTSPTLQDIPKEIQAQNIAALQKSVAGEGGVGTLQTGPKDVQITQETESELGKKLETTFREAEKGVTTRFGKEESEVLDPIRGEKLPQVKVGEKVISKEITDVDPNFPLDKKVTPEKVIAITKNQSSLDIKSQLKGLGFEGKGITGNERASGATISFLRNLEKKIDNAKTIENLIEQRRKIQTTLFRDRKQISPIFQSRDIKALNETYAKINERIAEQIKDPDVKNAWKEANRTYSEDRTLLEQISKGVGFEAKSTKSENYIKNLGTKIGIENLENLEKKALQNESLNDVFKEIKSGFYNDFVKTILTKDIAEISPDKFLTKWFQMKPELKKILIPPEVVKRIDNAHSKIMKMLGVDVSMLRGSRTAPLQELIKGGSATEVRKTLSGLVTRPIIKSYFKTGNFPAETVIHFLGKTARNSKVNNIAKVLSATTDPKKVQNLTQRLNAEYTRILTKEEQEKK